ncbi:hypothetical protein B0H10DRAFT_1964929 [Mycena sp. CBHHK59/15]|nr:hypothetical protein B0H10DRAFT_1964929 [Mycena sp. CBHHK59/15]
MAKQNNFLRALLTAFMSNSSLEPQRLASAARRLPPEIYLEISGYLDTWHVLKLSVTSSEHCVSGLVMLSKFPTLCAQVKILSVHPKYTASGRMQDEAMVATMIESISYKLNNLVTFEWCGIGWPGDSLWTSLRNGTQKHTGLEDMAPSEANSPSGHASKNPRDCAKEREELVEYRTASRCAANEHVHEHRHRDAARRRMPLDQNHHHQPARQGSPAPIVGAIRPRPPDATVSSDSDEGSPTPEVTKSPNTRRVVQRRKTQPGQPELEPLRYDADIDSDMPASTAPAPSTAAAGSGAALVAWPPEHVPLLAALESLLARAVATTTALQLEGEEVPPYPPPFRPLSALSAAPLTTPVDARSTTPPPRTTHHGIRTEPPSPRDLPSAPIPLSRNVRPAGARVSARHIAPFTGGLVHPLSLRNVLRRSTLSESWSARSPAETLHHAYRLASFFPRFDNAFKGNFRSFGGFGEKCILDVDTPWTWVVLHGVPAKAFWGVMDGEGQEIWTELTSQGYDKEVLTYHPMVKTGPSRDDEDHLSVKFAFTEEGSAKRLLAQPRRRAALGRASHASPISITSAWHYRDGKSRAPASGSNIYASFSRLLVYTSPGTMPTAHILSTHVRAIPAGPRGALRPSFGGKCSTCEGEQSAAEGERTAATHWHTYTRRGYPRLSPSRHTPGDAAEEPAAAGVFTGKGEAMTLPRNGKRETGKMRGTQDSSDDVRTLGVAPSTPVDVRDSTTRPHIARSYDPARVHSDDAGLG